MSWTTSVLPFFFAFLAIQRFCSTVVFTAPLGIAVYFTFLLFASFFPFPFWFNFRSTCAG